MNKSELFDELLKLAPSEWNSDFRKHLSNKLYNYLDLLSRFDESERLDDWDNILLNIRKIVSNIIETVKRCYEGQSSSAYSIFKSSLYKNFVSNDNYGIINEKLPLFRMRYFEPDDDEKPVRKSLFHIPFDKRGIVKTQRYSAPGYPCLYLGLSIYTCWEEMHRPMVGRCFVSYFKCTENLKMLNLSILDRETFCSDVTEFKSFLKRFPLIIATMIKVNKNKDFFKPEYIIPQLLMEWIIELQKSKKIDKTQKPIGIAYTSVHINKQLEFPQAVFYNFAIPAISPFSGKYSKELCDYFLLTEPTSEELEKVRGTFSNASNIYLYSKEDTPNNKYFSSLFGILEKQLRNEVLFPLQKLNYKE